MRRAGVFCSLMLIGTSAARLGHHAPNAHEQDVWFMLIGAFAVAVLVDLRRREEPKP